MSIPKFFKKKEREPIDNNVDRGFLVFENTSDVILAEKLLKVSGLTIQVMGPPPEIQSGCDLVIEFPLIEELKIVRMLKDAGVEPLQMVPVSSPLLQPVDVFNVKDLGGYLMVRAANMKLTVDRETSTIVNVSGGGCPDVPYLAARLIGKRLSEAPNPNEIGQTLCGYALELACEEIKRQCDKKTFSNLSN